jgi:PKD repeat protein
MNPTNLFRTLVRCVFLSAAVIFAAPFARAALPVIYSFDQSGSATINLGQSVTFNWSVSNGASVSLAPGIGPVTGTQVTVTPTQTTTYVLTATNSSGSVTRSKKITVMVPPSLNTLTATPSTVLPGGTVALTWSGTGASYYTVTTDAGVNLGNVFGTSTRVYPQTTTTYTVTAVNSAGTGSRSVPVTVVPPGPKPAISYFTASPAAITAGNSTTLNWEVSGADTISISPSLGTVTGTSAAVSPAATTTYTLTAKNLNGSVTKKATVTVTVPPPVIGSFTATPDSIAVGQGSMLAWSVTGATSLSISPDVGSVSGSSIAVNPAASTTYTLTATNAGGSVAKTVSLTVAQPVPPPVIGSFAAQPAVITEGQSSTLAWTIDGATQVSIAADVGASPGVVPGSSYTVSPTQSTNYTITATNASGSVSRVAAITVNPPAPTITAFNASPVTIFPGQSSNLTWAVNGSAALFLTPAIGAVSGTGHAVSPLSTTAYTLTAANAGGSDTATLTVSVIAPVIQSFTASAVSINSGQSTALNWTVDGASEITIAADVGASPGIVSGNTFTVSPTQNTVYTLTARNSVGFVTSTATVAVQTSAPVISAFTATPTAINSGGSTTLNWSVSGADTLAITPGVGVVTGNYVVVTPTVDTTYTLTATNADGSVTRSAAVTVSSPTGPSIDTFSASSTNVNAGDAVTLTWTTTQMGGLWMSADAGGDPGSVPANGSLVVHPQTTTRYTVSGWNGETNSMIFKSLTVTVGPPPAPTINSFAASPSTIAIGASTTLNWSVANADTLTISADSGVGPGVVTGSSITVSPTVTTTYTLTATRGSVSATHTATVAVTGPTAPVIGSFYAQPAFIQSGASTTLSWSVSGADTLSITPGIGSVTGTSIAVSPTQTTTYTLTATNAIGASTRSTAVTIYTPGSGSAQHPRVWLTPASLAGLQQRAIGGDPAWIRLRNECDSLATRPVAYPDEESPASGSISGGYQYEDYLAPAMNLSLGFAVAKIADPNRAATYGTKLRELLLKLSDPVRHGRPTTDSGWSIRIYVPALALGFDWGYELFTDSERAQIFTEINRWIESYESSGFGRDFPQGNYFAGYYAAKAIGALATEGDNPASAAMWSDWLNRVHFGMVQPYHQQWLRGGGAPDGWNYGKFETVNMVSPLAAAFTAKGMDLIHDTAHPHAYPDGHAKWITQFTWPDLKTVSERGLVYPGNNPSVTTAEWATNFAGVLRLANGDNAPLAQRYALDLRSEQGSAGIEPWIELLFHDPAAPVASYRTELSYRTTGDGQVAMRSSWAPDAVWASFQSGPYTGYVHSAEEFFDEGSLAIQRGGVQFLVNAWAALLRHTPGTEDAAGPLFSQLAADLHDTSADGVYHGRRLFNTFYAVRPGGYWGQGASLPGETATTLSRFEEGTDYVLMRGANLEGMYFDDHPIQAWTRTVVYLRPQLFVVYDRTSISSAGVDNWMAWHVAAAPAEQPAATGTHRFDVLDTRIAYGGNLFRGRVTTVLPAGHAVQTFDLYNQHKVYRLEVRPGSPAAENTWLTVFDASASDTQAGNVGALTVANGNLSAADAEGTVISNATGNYVVLFSKTAHAIAGSFSLSVPADDTYLLVADLMPGTGYSVTATITNGITTLVVAPGGNIMTTSDGTLKADITAAGIVTGL